MRYIYRARDILFASLGLIFLSPAFWIIGLAIKNDSPGPVFYRGHRAAKGGGVFHIIKFRTMYECPESYNGEKVTAGDDSRITPVGQWLRNTKLNELPQLWNVLKGDMSLVGPRPEDPDIVAEWPDEMRKEILSVRPGITSPASVLYRDEEGMLNNKKVMEVYLDLIQPSKMRLDQIYVRNRSLWLDMDVILWTGLVFLPRLRSYKPPERLLFIGPLSKFRHQFITWFTIDLITAFCSFGVVGLIWRTFSPIHIGLVTAILASFSFAFLFSVIGGFVGIHRIHWSKASAVDIIDIFLSTIIASLTALFINWMLIIMPYQLILMASAVAFFGFVAVRYRDRLLTGIASRARLTRRTAMQLRERVLIIGCGDAGLFVTWLLENSRRANKYSMLGFIDDDIYKHNTRVRGVKVIGSRSDIPKLVKEKDIGIIIFAIHNIPSNEQNKIMKICQSTSAQIVIFPDVLAEFDRILSRRLKPDYVGAGKIPVNQGLNLASALSTSQMEMWLKELRKDIEMGRIDRGIKRIKELQERIEE